MKTNNRVHGVSSTNGAFKQGQSASRKLRNRISGKFLETNRVGFYSRQVNYTPEIETRIKEILTDHDFDRTYLQHAAHTSFIASVQDSPPGHGSGWLWEMGRQFSSASWKQGEVESGPVKPRAESAKLTAAQTELFVAIDSVRMQSEKAAALMLAASDILNQTTKNDDDICLALSTCGLSLLTSEVAFELKKANDKAMAVFDKVVIGGALAYGLS